MIEIKNLTKIYSGKVQALNEISMDVQNGEIVGFVGLNGAGKTTTIRISAGVTLPTSGTVLIDGKDIVKEKVEASKSIGWVPEFPNFNLNMKAMDLMLYFSGFYGLDSKTAKSRSLDLLREVGLEGQEYKKLQTYSQGMKKRFALAAALISEPRNFLMDEVLNGLDPEGIMFFRDLSVKLKNKGSAVLFSSHILSEVQNIADRVVIIHKGNIIRTMRRDELDGIGKPRIVLKIDNRDEKIKNLLENYGDLSFKNDSIVLDNVKSDLSIINSELVKNGYRIKEFYTEHENLEEFFLKLVGVKK